MPRHKPKPPNPISAAIQEWFDHHSREDLTATIPPAALETLLTQAPKRWVVYEPMVLLPSGSFTSPAWQATLTAASAPSKDVLWRTILRNIGAKSAEKTTHLAVNDGIPLTVTTAAAAESPSQAAATDNILRSPIGLRTLHGDFGPSSFSSTTNTGPRRGSPSQADFERAFWVSTKQNGVLQTWAPRWTMFSRGNVKEKTRLLGFHDADGSPTATATATDQQEPSPLAHRARRLSPRSCAIDLYGGIGYFVFSYARLGLRVLCWELNPWSVEGLRRGAIANGWVVRVVEGEEELRRPTREVVGQGEGGGIVVFLEDNREAARRVRELRACGGDDDWALPVVHVNCGLLPRSDDSWEAAREILGGGGNEDGWLHLHENVGVKDIESRRAEIQSLFDGWDQQDGGDGAAKVEHVELVKTFAPDVWHCVFDVYITKSRSIIAPR